MAKKTTIVLLNGFGNHSNRLFQATHLEAFALEHGLGFYNPSFHDMASLYHCDANPLDKIICAPAKFLRIMKKFIRFNDRIMVHFDEEGKNDYYHDLLLHLAQKSPKYIFVDGWNFRNHDLTIKHRDFFKKKYAVKEHLLSQNNFVHYKPDHEKHVAVHIRRTDYREFAGGKYFYDLEVYRQCMDSIKKEIQNKLNSEVKFIVFSDEDASSLQSDEVIISRYPWYIDQLLMSRCDYIIGPPSTFSHWASYIGKAEFYHIQSNTDVQLRLDNFKPCDG